MWTNENLCNIIYLIHLNTFHWKAIALWYPWKIRQRNWHWIAVISYSANSSCSHCASAFPVVITEFSGRYTFFQFHDDIAWVVHASSRVLELRIDSFSGNSKFDNSDRITGKICLFFRRWSIKILWCSTTWNFTTSLCQTNRTRLI